MKAPGEYFFGQRSSVDYASAYVDDKRAVGQGGEDFFTQEVVCVLVQWQDGDEDVMYRCQLRRGRRVYFSVLISSFAAANAGDVDFEGFKPPGNLLADAADAHEQYSAVSERLAARGAPAFCQSVLGGLVDSPQFRQYQTNGKFRCCWQHALLMPLRRQPRVRQR